MRTAFPRMMAPSGAEDVPEFDPDRFDDEEADRRVRDLRRLDGILAGSELTEDDIEMLDAILKEGIRERHVELATGQAKRGMDKI